MATYTLIPAQSRFTVQVFAGGLLSVLAHNPVFAVRDFSGTIEFDPAATDTAKISLSVAGESLELVENFRPADRAEIETIARRDVLETAAYPRIEYRSAQVAADRVTENWFRLRITGELALHGITRKHALEVQCRLSADRARLSGDTSLRLSDHGLKKVSALGGTITVKEEVKLTFDLVAQ